jgi:hypothetical protein
MLLHSKVTSEGGGGGGSVCDFKIKLPTITEKLYYSVKAIFLKRSIERKEHFVFEVLKDTNGEAGEKTLSEAIDICAEMLTDFKFQGSNQLFQHTLSMRLSEVMKNVLLKNEDVIPLEGGELNE